MDFGVDDLFQILAPPVNILGYLFISSFIYVPWVRIVLTIWLLKRLNKLLHWKWYKKNITPNLLDIRCAEFVVVHIEE